MKIQHLQLIQIGGRPPAEDGAPPKDSLAGIADQKDRIQEYHHRVNERRKKIHERQMAKRREQEALESQVLSQGAGGSIKKKKATAGEKANESSSQIDDVDELEEERLRQEASAAGRPFVKKSKKNKGKKGSEKL